MEKGLNELRPFSRGRVKSVEGAPELKKKLLEMGIIPGSPLEVLRVAPFGDPVEVKIKGYNLSLRKNEAKQVSVEVD